LLIAIDRVVSATAAVNVLVFHTRETQHAVDLEEHA
jgi:hypothetical protein